MAAINRRSLATASFVLLALTCVSSALAGSSSVEPTPLAAGERGSYSWSVKASHLTGSKPCVTVAITHSHGGPFNYDRSRFRECALESHGLSRAGSPLLVGGTHVADRSRMTVFGVLASAGARKVHVSVSDGLDAKRVSTRLEPIGRPADQGAANRYVGLRFAVIALPGRECIERLATQGTRGRILWQGAPDDYECGYPTPGPAQ